MCVVNLLYLLTRIYSVASRCVFHIINQSKTDMIICTALLIVNSIYPKLQKVESDDFILFSCILLVAFFTEMEN